MTVFKCGDVVAGGGGAQTRPEVESEATATAAAIGWAGRRMAAAAKDEAGVAASLARDPRASIWTERNSNNKKKESPFSKFGN